MSDEIEQPPPKRRGGRPRYRPSENDRRQVRTLTGMGLTHDEISHVIGIAAPTLRKYFRHELDVGQIEANAQVAASLFRQATHATKPNAIVGIFWMKARGGWRDHDSAGQLGKKEQQQEQAQATAQGRRFAPGSAPPSLKLVSGSGRDSST